MEKKKVIRAVLMVCTLFMVICAGQTETVKAASRSLTIRRAASNSKFSLYQVGTLDSEGNLKLNSVFEKYAVNIDLDNEAALGRTAETLANYITQDHLAAYATATADARGTVSFTELDRGLYLAVGDTVIVDGTGYIQNSIMTAVPASENGGEPIDHVEAVVKAVTFKERGSYSVYKRWNDGDSEDRPVSIKVNLIQDRNIYDTVTLSEENNWQHKWTGLEKGHVYMVTETDVADGYTVEISRNAGVFTITNNHTENIRITPTPSGGNPPSRSGSGNIPQTGQLWWPVSWLAAAGVLCLANGLRVNRKKEKK